MLYSCKGLDAGQSVVSHAVWAYSGTEKPATVTKHINPARAKTASFSIRGFCLAIGLETIGRLNVGAQPARAEGLHQTLGIRASVLFPRGLNNRCPDRRRSQVASKEGLPSGCSPGKKLAPHLWLCVFGMSLRRVGILVAHEFQSNWKLANGCAGDNCLEHSILSPGHEMSGHAMALRPSGALRIKAAETRLNLVVAFPEQGRRSRAPRQK
jgi:hypothetical protein